MQPAQIGDKVWLSKAMPAFLKADRGFGAGVERDPGVGEGYEAVLRAGGTHFPSEKPPGVLGSAE